ncbi:MAG TPA: L,D-transpeptidase family protein [Gammaproteobacteria bacterium]|nr:L,D-transpeptidase family protein [Gammaproteobacteria bacterium]
MRRLGILGGVRPRTPDCVFRSLARCAPGALSVGLLLLGGCGILRPDRPAAPAPATVATAPDPHAPRLAPLDTRDVTLAQGQELIGETQVLFTRYENTFPAIGREFDLGFDELRAANAAVDPWLPGEATPVYLPTQTVLPDAPREGIVINVPAMRLYYFTAENGGAATPKAPAARVTTHPVGIGAEGWATPIAEAKVSGKVRDPVWYVPASVRKEHASWGEKLPSVVPPGPDNPLGEFALTLSLPSYLIHGTNKPAGVGMRSSHGCIRLYPEDIEELFGRVARGTHVQIVNQPVLAGWRDGVLYLEVHRPLAEETRDLNAEAERALAAALERAGRAGSAEIDHALVGKIAAEQRGVPFPVLRGGRSLEQHLASARIVENKVPFDPTFSAREQAAPPIAAP